MPRGGKSLRGRDLDKLGARMLAIAASSGPSRANRTSALEDIDIAYSETNRISDAARQFEVDEKTIHAGRAKVCVVQQKFSVMN